MTVPARALGAIQCALGAALVLRPERVVGSAVGARGAVPPLPLVRVLGVRSLAQGVVTTAAPTATVLESGALVDVAHALSMLPVIMFSRRYRSAAAASAALAGVSATVGLVDARRTRRTAATS